VAVGEPLGGAARWIEGMRSLLLKRPA
jgi:hypothetical protein